jgi:TonB family protein
VLGRRIFSIEGDVSVQRKNKGVIRLSILFVMVAFISATLAVSLYPVRSFAQDHFSRKVKSRVYPQYPEIARKMALTGSVKLEVVVGANGNVKDTKVIGGHPILVTAALDAVKKWKFDPSAAETTETVEFKFDPSN